MVQFGKVLCVLIGSVLMVFGQIGVIILIFKFVKVGDCVVVVFWVCVQKIEGDVFGKLCCVQLEVMLVVWLIFDQVFDVMFIWMLYKLSGKVDCDYVFGQFNVVFYFGCVKQMIDLGLVFIFDYGQ